MTAGCAGCGACCNPVRLSYSEAVALQNGSDENSLFAKKHWRLEGVAAGKLLIRCDHYDPQTAQCTAHSDRPPICSGFPFYGRPATPVALGANLSCSYWYDIPSAWRPPDVRPLIPIEVVTH